MDYVPLQTPNKKTNLFMLLEENDENDLKENEQEDYKPRSSQIPLSQGCTEHESTLNSSTVPTYEEFTKKSSNDNYFKFKKYRQSANRFLNSTEAMVEGLLTDDESQESDKDEDDELLLKHENQLKLINSKNLYIKSSTSSNSRSNSASENDTQKESVPLLFKQIQNTPTLIDKTKNVEKNTPSRKNYTTPIRHIKLIQQTPSSACSNKSNEYYIYDCKDTQTSFLSSQEQNKNNASINSGHDNSDLIINESQEKENLIVHNSNNKNNKNCLDEITEITNNFKLKLSSSSSSVASLTDNNEKSDNKNYKNVINNVTLRKNRKKSSLFNNKNINTSKNSCNLSHHVGKMKRVSICGEIFSDNVLKIDDSIIDEYDNELDHKSGKLLNLDETNIDTNKNEFSKEGGGDISLNKNHFLKPIDAKTNKIKAPSSSSDDDRFEQFLSQYKQKNVSQECNKITFKKDLKDFIVNDSDLEEIDENFQVSINNKNDKKDSKYKEKETELVTLSSDENEDLYDDEKTESSDGDLYGKDLQLFYIKTTNKLTNETKQKLKNKSKGARSSLLDGSKSFISLSSTSSCSSDSESSMSDVNSPLSIKTSSTFDSSASSLDEDKKNIFRKNIPVIKQLNNIKTISSDLTNFKTPLKQNTKTSEKDYRLIKTQQVKKKQEKLSFVESLSTFVENEEERDMKAIYYMKKFKLKKVKQELLKECYDEINKYAFRNQLPKDMLLLWNSRLSSTGGFCKNKTSLGERSSEIHISTKVCDSPERMRDTLAHEMCHAAAFLINGLLDGHGKVWRSWANQVNITFKKIPRITIKHSYEIKKKYIYRCEKCHNEIHRFSKSIDVEKEICGICYGKFELLLNDDNYNQIIKEKLDKDFNRILNNDLDYNQEGENIRLRANNAFKLNNVEATPSRQINKFALYVKDNYNSIKQEKKLSKHKDIMQELSKNFKSLSTK